MTYVVLTAARLLASLRLAWWFYPPGKVVRVFGHRHRLDPDPAPSPLLKAIGVYFYVVAGLRAWWLVRSGLSSSFAADAFVIGGVAVEALVLFVMCWMVWRRTI